MNVNTGTVNTGTVIDYSEAEIIAKHQGKSFEDIFCKVDENEMTPKQKKTKRVSLSDRTSKLGKKLTSERKKRKIAKAKLCSCGSGLKPRKCCRFR